MSKVKIDIGKLTAERMKQVDSLLTVELNPNDPSLEEQLSMGDNWDDPSEITKHMDMQPLWYARWASLYRAKQSELRLSSEKFKTWYSVTRQEVYDILYDENIENGMTPNNAKPVEKSVDARFDFIYRNPNPETDEELKCVMEYNEYKDQVEKLEYEVDQLKIVVEALIQRKDMLISLGSMVRTMLDHKLKIQRK